MADIVLFYPRTGFDIQKLSVDIPLSILAAASLAVKDFDVVLIDQRTDPNWRQTLIREVEAQPLLLGVSSMTGKQISSGLEAARVAREVDRRVKIVWGGVHPTLLPEQTLENQFVDIIVRGEGEATLSDLAQALDKKKSLATVAGIGYKENGEIFLTEKRDHLDLNTLPPLPYHLIDMEAYVGSQGRFEDNATRSLIYISSRGCPWQCTFCCNPKLSARRWRALDADQLYDQVSGLVQKYNLDAITFHDEEFLVDKKRSEKVAEMIGGKFDWWIQARMDRLLNADVEKLAAGGLMAVQPGIESGSDRILKMIKKGETVAHIKEANRKLASTPIVPLYNFMMGFPGETKEELDMTVDLALDLIKDNANAEVSGFYVFVPYPGTELFDAAVERNFVPPATLEEWAQYNRQHLDTPWVQQNRDDIENLIFMAKLVDGKRIIKRAKQALPYAPIPAGVFDFFTKKVRRKWEQHDYGHAFETRALKFVGQRFMK